MTHQTRLAEVLAFAKARLPEKTWDNLASSISDKSHEIISLSGVESVLKCVANTEVHRVLRDTLVSFCNQQWRGIAPAVAVTEYWSKRTRPDVDLIWTGPSSGKYTTRRIDQILYDLITDAKRRIFLTTFSAFKVERLSSALMNACTRDVKISLLLETTVDSEGQLSADAINAFLGLPLKKIEILHWPKEQRERNQLGRPGKLHAKCAVIDDHVLISSANLTDDAFSRNIEMGVSITSSELAESVLSLVTELRASDVIQEYTQPDI